MSESPVNRRSFLWMSTIVGGGALLPTEDTVLFPALRQIVSKQEFAVLGEDFEKKEHHLFGEDGFEKMVVRVASIEKTLGIYDLAQFTPKL